eukprot:TRINITY_DN2018_c0_g1_i2.p1 TRINITY_DN2018_c0_g1~~TRINITY_DN2018_c0_g1_i2.p1  ORF type:complete len:142 (+),score=0.67 TRINITY_DN2018_c0_g1_i2:426-851(+)
MALSSKTPVLLSSRCQSSQLPVLVHRIAYPVDSWIIADSIVKWIYKNYLIIFVCTILIDPVRIEDSEPSKLSSSPLLGHGSQIPLKFQLSDTLVLRFSINDTFRHWSLPASASYPHSVNHITLERDRHMFNVKNRCCVSTS